MPFLFQLANMLKHSRNFLAKNCTIKFFTSSRHTQWIATAPQSWLSSRNVVETRKYYNSGKDSAQIALISSYNNTVNWRTQTENLWLTILNVYKNSQLEANVNKSAAVAKYSLFCPKFGCHGVTGWAPTPSVQACRRSSACHIDSIGLRATLAMTPCCRSDSEPTAKRVKFSHSEK